MSIATQNFDGVTAPALPSGWTFDARMQTSTSYSTSSPNALELVATTSATYGFATFNTLDGNWGNVVVQCNLLYDPLPGLTGDAIAGVVARASATPIVTTSGSFYLAVLDFVGAQVRLYSYVSGTATAIATLNVSGGFTATAWYALSMALNGSQITVSVQRLSDGFWINGSGVWSASVAGAIAVTDSSIPAASGYSGIAFQSNQVAQNPYADDWSLTAIATTCRPNPSSPGFPTLYYPHSAQLSIGLNGSPTKLKHPPGLNPSTWSTRTA